MLESALLSVPPVIVAVLSGCLVLLAMATVFAYRQRRLSAGGRAPDGFAMATAGAGVASAGSRPSTGWFARSPSRKDATAAEQAAREAERRRQLLVAGAMSTGHIESATRLDDGDEDSSAEMELVLDLVDGPEAPRRVAMRTRVPGRAVGCCQPGAAVVARVDRNDPDYIVIDW